jgi:predicted phage baseplate assembly protein
MNGAASPGLNDCGCCEGVQDQTPVDVENAAGLGALAYRVGTHSRFKQSMQVDLTRHPVLLDLKTRRDDDPTIGLLDAWATVLDVLTFYQERIANEGYLRTGTERRSLLELARSIGYELGSGVAASTFLMFTMEDAAGAPREAIVSAGTKAQSIPGQDEEPQTFETIEEINARPAWNELLPRATQLQELKIQDARLLFRKSQTEVRFLYVNGTNTGITPGDLLLVTTVAVPEAAPKTLAKRVVHVTVDDELKRTRVELETSAPIAEQLPAAAAPIDFDVISFPPNAPPLPFNEFNIEAKVLTKRLRESDLQTLLEVNRWSAEDLMEFVAKRNAGQAAPNQALFAFRERSGFFGNNAPPYASLKDKNGAPLFTDDWDASGWPIWNAYPAQPSASAKTSSPQTAARITGQFNFGTEIFEVIDSGRWNVPATDPCLERSVSGIAKNSWTVFSDGAASRVYRVTQGRESSSVGFGMSGKTTVLTLADPDNGGPTRPPTFLVRNTTAWVKSEELELAPLPVSDLIKAGTTALELDDMFLGLRPGQLVVLSGEQRDAPGVIRQELLALQEIIHHDGRSTLLYREESAGAGLHYSYWRKTVKLNANVARATHGETKREVLGSGDAAQAFQKFLLKQSPLTYVSAPTPAGVASTLQLRVNDVLWDEAPSLYRRPPSERTYVTRRSDEGKTTAQFGDGITGARLPSGTENVTATYRVGLGLGGLVKANQISLLLTRSLGLKEVINPLPATGAADAETRDEARENAPFTVLTLDRIVSLQDFEDFARAYPGIGKAQATWLWQGEHKLIHITIAGGDGRSISTVSALYKNLILSLESARDPGPRVRVASFTPLFFNLQAKLLVTRGYLPEKVRAAALAAILSAFSFPRRAFGQAVTKGEVYSVIQGVEGVDAVDVDKLYLSSKPATLENRLPVRTAGWDEANTVVHPAELLLVNPREIQLTEMPA